MAISPMLFDSVALNVLELFFPTDILIIKRKNELVTFINGISELTDAESLISLLVAKHFLESEGGEFFTLTGHGMELYGILKLLSNISNSTTSL